MSSEISAGAADQARRGVTATPRVTREWKPARVDSGRMSHYYDPSHLERFGEIGKNRPELAGKFFDYYQAVFAEGALSPREKSLIALAVAHAVQCPYCIEAYTRDALEKGADLDQMTESVHVATAIKAGATLIHGLQMRGHAAGLEM